MRRNALLFIVCLAMAVMPSLPAFAGTELPTIEDDEEYRVFAAVLFPNEPEIPEQIKNDPLRRDLYLSERPRLDGLGLGKRFAAVQELAEGNWSMKSPSDGSDAALYDDYRRKNEKPARISTEKLFAHLPKDHGIRIIAEEEINDLFRERDGWDRFRQRYPFAGGIKAFSRIGFDPARTQAVVFIRHQAHYRMGVGYFIYLEKSSTSGKWIITGSRLTYIS